MLKGICKYFKGNKGASLVELSIIIASVAAIAVVTVGGISMVKKTRLGDIVEQMAQFASATANFEDKYGGLPGDIADASAITGATAGNGNGSIDTAAEALHFWRHLSLTGLIKGSYDGSSTNAPGAGVPAGTFAGSGYSVIDPSSMSGVSTQAIVIEMAGFSSSANNLAILRPEDVKAIDDSADDGNPNTGKIRALDGSDVDSGDCVTGGSYNMSDSTLSCRVRFILSGHAANVDASALGGSCNQIGLTRESPTTTNRCPEGFRGKAIETCRISDADEGAWELTDVNCEPVTCIGGKKYSETRTLACINGMDIDGGAGITQTCSANGIWVTDSSSCIVDAAVSCPTNGSTRIQACDLGETGRVLQTCTANVWVTSDEDCTTIQCSSPTQNIGTEDQDADICTDSTYHSGSSARICAMDSTWLPTSLNSTCRPQYAACDAGTDTTQTIGCPPGESGEHTQTCVDADTDYWTTLTDTCKPITCDGENIGTTRIKEGSVCPNDYPGTVMEVCTAAETWTVNYGNCAANVCNGNEDTLGNAVWPMTDASSAATGTCISGYVESGGSPSRNCDANNEWEGSVTNSCIRTQCPAETSSGATWPLTNSNISGVVGACVWPNYEGLPRKDCSADGNWTNSYATCKTAALPIKTDLLIWLDANDFTTVHENSSCSDYAENSDDVACWQDKSGNGHDVVEKTSLDLPVYQTNGISSKAAVFFDGNDLLWNSDVETSASDYTFFVVSDVSDISTTNQSYFDYRETGSPFNRLRLEQVGYTTLKTAVGHNTDTWAANGDTQTGKQIMSFRFYEDDSGDDIRIFKNGVEMDSYSSYTQTSFASSSAMYVGASYNSSNFLESSYLGELVGYNTALSDANMRSVGKYLGDKWEISYLPVPSGNTVNMWLDGNDVDALFQDSSCATVVTADNQTVGCWQDKSGNDMDMTQTASTSYEPTYNTNVKNGKSSVTFDGTNDYMYRTGVTTDSIGDPDEVSIAMAIYTHTSAGGSSLFDWYDSPYTGGRFNMHAPWSDNITHFDYGTACCGATHKTNYTDKIMEGRWNTIIMSRETDDTGTFWLNGAYKYSDTGNSSTFTSGLSGTLYIATTAGSDGTIGTNREYDGDIGELIFFDKALTAEGRNDVNTYLSDKWGIYALPSDSAASPLLWYDAADADTLFSNTGCTTKAVSGNTIACWEDKAQNGNNATHATLGPQYNTSTYTIGNLPALDFQGNDALIVSGLTSGVANYTAFAVLDSDATAAHQYLLDSLSGRFIFQLGDYGWYNASNGGHQGYYSAVTGEQIITWDLSTTSGGKVYRNGRVVSEDTYTVGENIGSTVALGGQWNAGGYFVNARLGEFILYNTTLSVDDRSSVEAYLSDKWSVYSASLPVMDNLQLWLDADDPLADGTHPADLSSLTTWYDKGLNAYDATQATESLKPTFELASINNMPGIYFDGTEYLDVTSASNGILPQSFIAAIQVDSGNNADQYLFSNAGSFSRFSITSANLANYFMGDGNGNLTSDSTYGVLSTGSPNVIGYVYDGNLSYKIYINGVLSGQNNPGEAGDSYDFWVGGANPIGTYNYTGHIGEIVFYSDELTEAEVDTMTSYMNDKWGVTSTVFEPDDIADQWVWLDAQDTSTLFQDSCSTAASPVTASGQTIGCWQDKSGNGAHATQTVTSREPTYLTGGINSRASVEFPAANDCMVFDSNIYHADSFYTMFLAMHLSAVDSYRYLFDSGSGGDRLILEGGNGSYYDDSAHRGPSGTTTEQIMTWDFHTDSATGGTLYRNGTLLGSYPYGETASGSDISTIAILGCSNSEGVVYDTEGDFGEFLIYDRSLTTAEKDTIEMYLSHKWGVSIANP